MKNNVLDDFPLCPQRPPPPLETAHFIFIVVSPFLIIAKCVWLSHIWQDCQLQRRLSSGARKVPQATPFSLYCYCADPQLISCSKHETAFTLFETSPEVRREACPTGLPYHDRDAQRNTKVVTSPSSHRPPPPFRSIKNLLMPLFLMGCFPGDFQEGKRPTKLGIVRPSCRRPSPTR